MKLEFKSRMFPLEILLNWASNVLKGSSSCPEQILVKPKNFGGKSRELARKMYPKLKIKQIKEKLGNFIICMAIDNIRGQLGIKLRNYRGK